MPQLSPRLRRVADAIRKEIAANIPQLNDPKLHRVTISDVGLARDLSTAKVYISAIDEKSRKESVTVLNKAAGFLRARIAEKLQLRVVPRLQFLEDISIAHGDHLIQVLSDIKLPEKPHDE